MLKNTFYAIGLSGIAWTEKEKKQWLKAAVKSRSYQDDVISKLETTSQTQKNTFELLQYGALSIDPNAYPLFAFKTTKWDTKKPTVVITGGVHGYETSGVHGAIQFMDESAEAYLSHFNIVTLPCVSPWGYEHIARWNPYTVDPNRSFVENSPSEEAKNVMQFIAELTQVDSDNQQNKIMLHIDLHETTDSDESEFRPALAARDGESYIADTIPDGFYLVGDTENKQQDFQSSIIKAVSKVTHIAPADEKGEIIGSKAEDEGIIYYPLNALGLCASVTNANYTTTTEVYPDSKKVTDADCNNAQVAAIKAALDYVIKKELSKS